ncbi:MAG: tautomerase family protein, partial [Chloroflexota bacterium]|nr:tautomerase family protein [Chloroflexota bacterium]
MAQIRIYGRHHHIDQLRLDLSDAIHACAVEALGLPEDKRFHRFIALDAGDFIHPADRSERYT